MRKYIFLTLLLLFVFSGTVQSQPVDVEPAMTVLNESIHLHWQTPPIEWVTDEEGRLKPLVNGYELSKDEGQYQLPFYSVLVALPPSAMPTLEFTAVSTTQSLSASGAIAPRAEGVVYNSQGEVVGGDYVAVNSAEIIDQPSVQLEEIGKMRGVRLARVTFYPLHYLDGNSVRVISEVDVTIHLNSAELTTASNTPSTDQLTSAVRDMVINPQHVQNAPQASRFASAAMASAQGVVIEVAQAGITAVTRSDITGTGFSLSGVNPNKLQLTQNGVVIPFEWDGDGDAQFEANERIIFYANPEFSRWSNHDSYILSVESSNGARINSVASSVSGLSTGQRYATLLLEENAVYNPNCYCGALPLGRDGDRWMWDDLRQPGRPENDYAFDLPLADASKTADLTVWFIGFTSVSGQNPDHKVAVSLNNSSLGNVTWDARTAVTETLTIPVSTLQSNNTLNLNLPGINGVAIDGVWFDAALLRYVLNTNSVGNRVIFEGASADRKYTTRLNNLSNIRVYDVTTPTTPVLLTNLNTSSNQVTFGDTAGGVRTYAISNENGLLSPSNVRQLEQLRTDGVSSADYVIVSPPDFISTLTPLVNLRKSQDLDVVVEDVEAIYDQFGNGRSSPEAIKAFLASAYTNWSTTYVLLVGDASTDPKQYLDTSPTTWLLPYMAEVDPWIGEVPADNRYVTVDGDDIVPDMIVGRFPVNSVAETQIVVNKIVAYESEPAFGSWNAYVSMVADNRDTAGDFANHSDDLGALHIPDPYITRPIYYLPDSNTPEQVIEQIQQSWAFGNGMLFYNGHSSVHQWGAERYFHLDDVQNLTNGGRLPIVLQMTCLTGSFHRPEFETLDEALLRREGGGAVAVWGATGLGVATGHEILSSGYLDSLLGGDPTVGPAILAGKIKVLTLSPTNDELVETYTLFGDPALEFNTDVWAGYNGFLPVIESSP